eukprot:365123-Chlamydomonas_euryale.AAC.37
MARKRRREFASQEIMIESLSGKRPFRTFEREVLELYVRYGTRPSVRGAGVELCCDPEFEACVYSSLDPPPSLEFSQIGCKTTVAVGRLVPGPHERLARLGRYVAMALPRGELER